MRLLIITQKVDKNDPILGFFHRWIEEFAKHCERVIVICLTKGSHELPENVKILSLGKENYVKHRVFDKFRYVVNFYKYIWQERKNYDKVFVHMNQEYVLLGGLFWRLWKKKIGLWYVHRQSNLKLCLAEKLTNSVFSSSPESFRVKSNKVVYVGHGIDPGIFRFSAKDFGEPISLVHVGRITRIKHIETIMRAGAGRQLSLVGGPVTADDELYQTELKDLASSIEADVDWVGFVSNADMPGIYSKYSISVNAAPDGGMDKVVLESWACGCPAFASNQAFIAVFGEYAAIFIFKHRDSGDLARKIENFQKMKNKEEIVSHVSKKIHSKYNLVSVVHTIIENLYVQTG